MDVRVLVGKQTKQGAPKIDEMQILSATDFGVKPEINRIDSKVLGSGRWTKDSLPGRQSVSGDFGLNPNVGEIELLLEGAGFKKQADTYKSGQFDTYLTIVNDFPSDDMNLQYDDCLINSLTITAAQESFLNVKASVIGMKNTVGDHKFDNSKAKNIDGALLNCYGIYLKDQNSDISATLESVEITINNSLEGRGGLNSRHFTKILQNGRGSIEVKIQFNAFDKSNYTKSMKMLTDNSSIKLELELREDITAENTKGKTILITLPKVKLKNVELGDLEGAGNLSKTMAALPDASGEPITFKITKKA